MEEADPNPRGRRHADDPVVGLTGARFGGAAGRRSRAAAEPTETNDAGAGLSGAQFPSTLSRWWDTGGESLHQALQRQEQKPEQQAAEVAHTQQPSGQQQGASQPHISLPVPESGWADGADEGDSDTSKETYDLVRPYSWTGGRTASCVDLAVETLVSATGRPVDPAAAPEHRTILKLCAMPHSVAELAALLKMPLGVARVLLGDLAAAGSVAIHRTVGSADVASDVALMQRVLAGLHRL
jgi:hypothetical protein